MILDRRTDRQKLEIKLNQDRLPSATLHPLLSSGRSANGGDRLVEPDAIDATARAAEERTRTFHQFYATTQSRHRQVPGISPKRRKIRRNPRR